MKKYLCMLAVVGLASAAFAQGTLTFNGGTQPVKDAAGTNLPKDGGFVQLFWAPANAAFVAPAGPTTTPAAFLAANTAWKTDAAYIKPIALGGRINGGTFELPTPTPGGSVDVIVAAWKGSAATFDAAIAANSEVGWSTKMANIATGNPLVTPAGFPGTLSGAFTSFNLSPVPEPSTLALAGLGAAALMIFRRRN